MSVEIKIFNEISEKKEKIALKMKKLFQTSVTFWAKTLQNVPKTLRFRYGALRKMGKNQIKSKS